MDGEVVSYKILTLCIIVSIVILTGKAFVDANSRSRVYLCNYRKGFELYARINQKDIISAPLNIQNSLSCMSRGMSFYDRSIESVVGTVKDIDIQKLSARYTLRRKDLGLSERILVTDKEIYIGGESRTLIFRKNIDLLTLRYYLRDYHIKTVVISDSQKEISSIVALKREGVNIVIVREGEFVKI